MMAIKQELEDQYSIFDIGLDWINLLLEKREFFRARKKTAFFGIDFFERGIFGKIGFILKIHAPTNIV